MVETFDRAGTATRIRALLAAKEAEEVGDAWEEEEAGKSGKAGAPGTPGTPEKAGEVDIAAHARRLGVEAAALRRATDPDSPHPGLNVLVAIVRKLGVDPTWLLTGKYDASSHRAALEDGAAEQTVRDLVEPRPSRISNPSPESVRSRSE